MTARLGARAALRAAGRSPAEARRAAVSKPSVMSAVVTSTDVAAGTMRADIAGLGEAEMLLQADYVPLVGSTVAVSMNGAEPVVQPPYSWLSSSTLLGATYTGVPPDSTARVYGATRGKWAIVRGSIRPFSDLTGTLTVVLPAQWTSKGLSDMQAIDQVGSAVLHDLGTRYMPGASSIGPLSSSIGFHHPAAGDGRVGAGAPWTWAFGDSVTFEISYELA